MRLQHNRSLLEAIVLSLKRPDDGVGADIELEVRLCAALPPAQDFIGAEPGQRLTAFVAVPEAVQIGRCFRFEATVLGGPQGERVVLTRPRELAR
jgi:hypothetical protein